MAKKGTSKPRGNSYERKAARELATWMFGDSDFLKRHSTSGMDKSVWCGDIVPVKQLPTEWKRQFPIFIETKTGYETHIPTFWKYTQILKWFKKAHEESVINNQPIIFLICQFKHKQPLLITNECVPPNLYQFNVAIPTVSVLPNIKTKYAYVYLFKKLQELNFYDCFDIQKFIQEDSS